jgi:hypothetical protein
MSDRLQEFAPLSQWDELPIHQALAPIRYVHTTDPRAFERYWFTAHAADGSFFLVTGMGVYPNLGVTDAYALLVHRGRQVTVRAHQQLSTDRAQLTVGPLKAELVSAFKEWHLTLGDNDLGFRFDIRWRDSKRAHYREIKIPHLPGVQHTRLIHDWAGYETFGTVEGTVEFDGVTLDLGAAKTRGSRDHHWGVRNGVGGPGFHLAEPRGSHCGQWVEFGDWSIWGDQILYNIGSAQPRAGSVQQIAYKLRFDPQTHHLLGGVITNRLANGELRDVTYEVIPEQTAYLRCAMYEGPERQGTPDKNHHHGMNVGDLVEGEVYDIRQLDTRQRIAGFEDHLCRATCQGEETIGILECKNPALYDMCRAGVPGFSFLES